MPRSQVFGHGLAAPKVRHADSIVDTSFLAEELRREYRKRSAPVEVDFRQLVNWLRLGDQRTHQLHSYPAKLLPHIAHFFLNASTFTSGRGTVLDPFSGSGTVALEASMCNRQTYVCDSNPLALLVTKVKTTAFDPDELVVEAVAIARRARRYRIADQINIVNADIWYSHERKKQLEILLRAINEVGSTEVKDFFRVCFSSVARRFSLADPAISVPVRLKTKPSFDKAINARIRARLEWIREADHIEEFTNIALANIERVVRTNNENPHRQAAIVVGADARNLKMPSGAGKLGSSSIPMVITSPPYGSAQKYIRATSLSLNWLGLAGPENLAGLEAATIGRENIPKNGIRALVDLPDPYEDFLSKVGKIDGRRQAITRQYLSDLAVSISEMARVISNGGHAIIVIGNNQVCGMPLTTDKFIIDSMGAANVEIDFHLVDHIKSRGLMTKRNTTASVISRESILVFRKP